MSHKLQLFRQLSIGQLFTYESPDNVREFAKLSETSAYEVTRPGEWGERATSSRPAVRVNPDILVFTKNTPKTDEVFAIGDANQLLGD